VRKSETRTPHDALFKASFKNPQHAAAVFRQVLPTGLAETLEWDTTRREAGSFIDLNLAFRHTDLLFSVQLAGQGTRVLLYLLLEHQSSNDDDMPLRILIYMSRIWESYHQIHGRPLPLLIPVVISHTPEGWTAPTSFHEMFEPRPDSIPHVAGLVPSFSYVLEDLIRVGSEALARWPMPAFAMAALRVLRDGRHFDQLRMNVDVWIEVIERLARGPEKDLVALEQLFRYILVVTGELRFAVFRAMIISQVQEAEEVAMTVAEELRAEGEARGLAKGRAETLQKQMKLKFGELSTEHAARIECATEQQLDLYIERILTAPTADAVFAE
jgi:predicted transposase YdaD